MAEPQPPCMPTLCVRQPWWQRLSHWLGNEGPSDGEDNALPQHLDGPARTEAMPYRGAFAGGPSGAAEILPRLGSEAPPDSAASRHFEPQQSLSKGAQPAPPPVERQSSRGRNPRRGRLQKTSHLEGKAAPALPTAKVKAEHPSAAIVHPPRSARSGIRSNSSHAKSGKEATSTKLTSPQQAEAYATRTQSGAVGHRPLSVPQLPEVKFGPIDMDAFQDGVWDLATIIPMPQEKGKPSRQHKSREQALPVAACHPIDDTSGNAAPQRSARGRHPKKIMLEGLPELIDREFGKHSHMAPATITAAPMTPNTPATATSESTTAPSSEISAQKLSSGNSSGQQSVPCGDNTRQALLFSEINSSAQKSLPRQLTPLGDRSSGNSSARQSLPSTDNTQQSMPSTEGSKRNSSARQTVSGADILRQPLHPSEKSSARSSLPVTDRSPGASGARRSLQDFSSFASGSTATRRSMPSMDVLSGGTPATRRSILSVNDTTGGGWLEKERSKLEDPEAWIATARARHSLLSGESLQQGLAGSMLPCSEAAENAAAKLADRYIDPVGKLKAGHAAWRRNHEALVKRRSAGVFIGRPDANFRPGKSSEEDIDVDVSFRPGRQESDEHDQTEESSSMARDGKHAEADEEHRQSEAPADYVSARKNSGSSSSSIHAGVDNFGVQRVGPGKFASGGSSSSRRSDDKKSSISPAAPADHPGADVSGAVAGNVAGSGSGMEDTAAGAGENVGVAAAVNSMAGAGTDMGEQPAAPAFPKPLRRNHHKRHTTNAEVFRSLQSESSVGNEDQAEGHRPRPSTPGPPTSSGATSTSGASTRVLKRQKTVTNLTQVQATRIPSKTSMSRPGTMEDPASAADDQLGPVMGDSQSEQTWHPGGLRWQSHIHGKLPMNVAGEEGEVNECLAVAKKHNLQINEVWSRYEIFKSYDQGQQGSLTQQDFEKLVRNYCNLPSDGPVPTHLLNRHWNTVDLDNDGKVSFEEFVVWSIEVDFAEEVMVPDPKERHLRQLARDHDFLLTDVERIKCIFDGFDTDRSGNIDEEEFRQALFVLLRAKNESDVSQNKVLRYWREADADRNGDISFEEFLLWYYRCFVSENGHFY